jgi:hypothetical protein
VNARQIILALVFFLPFFVFPFGTSFFEIPKVIGVEVGVEALLLVSLFSNHLKKLKSWVVLPFILLFLLTFSTLIINPDFKLFFGNIFRLQGVFLVWHLIVFAILSSQINVMKLNGFFYFLFLSMLLTLALIGFIFGATLNGRAVGTLGEPNSLAAVAIFFFTCVFFRNRWKYWIVSLIVCLELILLSGSRSGLFAFFVTIIYIILSQNLLLEVKKTSIIGFLLIVASLSFPFIEGGGWFENRAEIWQTAYHAGWSSPIYGNGFGNVQSSLAKSAKQLNNNVQYQIVDSSHNIFLDFWVQGGILGVLLFLWILIISVYHFLASDNRFMLALLIGLIYALCFNPLSVAVLVMFWYVLGQGLFKPSET